MDSRHENGKRAVLKKKKDNKIRILKKINLEKPKNKGIKIETIAIIIYNSKISK
ncbi:hypothetical protein [Hungatella sp.]|uniref:hypothetical protein n=1 Tax=Hungatella sp. TaxID=2613924 RepID=UPI002588379E|nr:hypothetical protein [Hungatella sp.]MCI6451170.1 hypothetical protein [Hungatella sp.]